MAKRKKKKLSKKKLDQKVADVCRGIDSARDQIADELRDAILDGRYGDLAELLYLDGRFKDLENDLNCSGVSKKSGVDKTLGQKMLSGIKRLKD